MKTVNKRLLKGKIATFIISELYTLGSLKKNTIKRRYSDYEKKGMRVDKNNRVITTLRRMKESGLIEMRIDEFKKEVYSLSERVIKIDGKFYEERR